MELLKQKKGLELEQILSFLEQILLTAKRIFSCGSQNGLLIHQLKVSLNSKVGIMITNLLMIEISNASNGTKKCGKELQETMTQSGQSAVLMSVLLVTVMAVMIYKTTMQAITMKAGMITSGLL